MPNLYKIYRGKRVPFIGAVVNKAGRQLNMRRDLYDHSPDGPEWGYYGSGPAQLALALLADYFGIALDKKTADEMALAHYQDFKDHVVAKWDKDRWTLDTIEIAKALEEIAEKKARVALEEKRA